MSPENAVLLCDRCADLTEARDPVMRARGLWACAGTDPRDEPMMLYGGDRLAVWRSAGDTYLFQSPDFALARRR
jgi:hypothetical protein